MEFDPDDAKMVLRQHKSSSTSSSFLHLLIRKQEKEIRVPWKINVVKWSTRLPFTDEWKYNAMKTKVHDELNSLFHFIEKNFENSFFTYFSDGITTQLDKQITISYFPVIQEHENAF